MNEEQIKHMVNRFLMWRLPENFNPDGGISFKRMFNENTDHPMKHEPVGTNLLDYTQAEQMVRYMVDGLAAAVPATHPLDKLAREEYAEGTYGAVPSLGRETPFVKSQLAAQWEQDFGDHQECPVCGTQCRDHFMADSGATPKEG